MRGEWIVLLPGPFSSKLDWLDLISRVGGIGNMTVDSGPPPVEAVLAVNLLIAQASGGSMIGVASVIEQPQIDYDHRVTNLDCNEHEIVSDTQQAPSE